MRRIAVLSALLVAVVTAGCAGGHRIPGADPSVAVPPDLPPSPATWPAYPHFPRAACWSRGHLQRSAPSVAPSPIGTAVAPRVLVRRVLGRLGDRRYISRITLTPRPSSLPAGVPDTGLGHPPADSLWAHIAFTSAARGPRASMVASWWEANLVGAALRDELCAAGGPPLLGWSWPGSGTGWVTGALAQRFPNPAPAAFRRRVALVGRRYGFRIVSLRLLRPLQLAPLLVVRTDRNRKAFAADLLKILWLLDPRTKNAATFEGLFFEARDRKGAFLAVADGLRGETWASRWFANPADAPFQHA